MDLYGNTSDLSGTGTGSTVEAVTTGTLESIPVIGGLLSGVVGNLNIAENVELVKKYGWSSWGASSSPEEAKANFVKYVYPWYEQNISGLVSGNAGAILTEMNQWLVANLESSKYRRKNHANAESTRLALDWMIKEYQSLISGIDQMVSKFKANGAEIKVTTYSAGPKEIAKPVFEDQSNVIDFFSTSTAIFKRYTGDLSGLVARVNESGEIEVKKGGGLGLLGLLGVGVAIFKGMK